MSWTGTVGVCVLTYNSELTVGYVIDSILKQSYPKEELQLIIVDGGSSDRSIDIAVKKLEGVNHVVISAPGTNIPQARNVCLEEAVKRGLKMLIFIDSDTVLLDQNLLEAVIRLEETYENAVIHLAGKSMSFKDPTSLEKFLQSKPPQRTVKQLRLADSVRIGMGSTLIPRAVFEKIKFENDLDFGEDFYYAFVSIKNGFRCLKASGAEECVVDVNLAKGAVSDIYWRIPLRKYLRSSKKKAIKTFLGCVEDGTLRISANRLLLMLARFSLNTFLLIAIPLTPASWFLDIWLFTLLLAFNALNLVLYPLYKWASGYPYWRGVANRFKFGLYSLLIMFWCPHSISEIRKLSKSVVQRPVTTPLKNTSFSTLN